MPDEPGPESRRLRHPQQMRLLSFVSAGFEDVSGKSNATSVLNKYEVHKMGPYRIDTDWAYDWLDQLIGQVVISWFLVSLLTFR
jgi:hypothetical protein